MQRSLLIVILLFCFCGIHAQSFTGNTGSIPGTSTTQTCFTNLVTGVGNINATTYGLSSVCVDITHPYTNELEILLTAPDGTVVPLSIQNGGGGNNYTGTCFTATAASSIKFANAPFTGTFLPEGYLGAVNNGQNADGTWSLCIQDLSTAGNAGTLTSWSINFDNNPAPLPPAIPACSITLPGTSSCANATAICDFNGLCGNTTGSTIQDWPGSGLNGCFGLENNSFLKFEAAATTASFTVWVPTSSAGPTGGIQMIFFSGTCGSGAVTSYGCYPHIFPYQSPGTPLPMVVSATGLTPGNTYYLMIDGFNNDKCTFSIAANTGINVLSINPAAPSICEGKSVSLTGSGGNGTYSWGPATGLNTTTGATVIASPTTSTNYTLTSTNSLGCSLTKDVMVNVSSAPVITTQPTTTTQRICLNDPIPALSVTATSGSGSISSYQWYITTSANNTSGAAWPGATSSAFSPASGVAGTLYVYCKVTNSNGCTTVSNVSGPIIISNKPAAPGASVTTQPDCAIPTGTIVVTSPISVNFEYSIGGGIYQASPTFTGLVPGSYNVTTRNIISGCSSPAKTLVVNAAAVLAQPTGSVSTQPTCTLPTGTIDITSPSGANIEYSNGGAYQASPTFAGLTNGATYNITARDIISGCVSAPLSLTVDPVPGTVPVPTASVTFQPDCSTPTGTITITNPSGANIVYSIGGAYQASAVFTGLTPGTYYVTAQDLFLPGCAVSAPATLTINAVPMVPTPAGAVTTQPDCTVPTGTITINSPSGSNIEYSNGGTYQASGVFAGLTAGTAYTFTARDISSGCVSATGLTLTVGNIPPAPAAPAVSPATVSYCENAPAAPLSATGTNLLWYTAASGGPGMATAPSVSTATVGTTTYYVSQIVTGCESARTSVTITVNAIPNAPIVTTPVIACQNTAAALSATGASLLWYTAATGGTGTSATPIPSTATAGSVDYYVSQTINGCESPRAAINLTVNPTPTTPSVTSPVVYCQNDAPAALTATGNNLLWYTTSSGGTGSATAIVPLTTTPGNSNYYVTQTNLGCESQRAAILVTTKPTPAMPGVTTPVGYCQNTNPSALTATGSNLLWYTASTGGTGNTAAPVPLATTPGNTFYFVSQTINGCEGPRIAITVTINKDSTAVTGFSYSPDTVCINGTNPGPAYALGFTTGGTFSSSAGISLNPSSGSINLAASTPGTYAVKYNYNTNGCIQGGSTTKTIVIKPAVSTVTLFSYSSPVCINAANPMPSVFAGFTTGGSFTSSQGIAVKPATGEVDLTASTPGSYLITYSLPALGCRLASNNFSFLNIVDTTRPVTTFSYSPAVTCIASATNPSLVKGSGFTNGGIFSATPAGLSINPNTGAISIGLSTPGRYTIKYKVPGFLCRLADSGTTVLTINAYGNPVTDFSYFSPVCQGDTAATAVPEINFTTGGIFSSTAGLVIDPNTGVVDLVKSVPGNYTIQYAVTAGDCNPAGSSTSSLNILNQPAAPDVTPVSICGPGETTLQGSALGTIKWYSEKELVNQVNVGNTLQTLLQSSTTYYLTNTVGTCESKAAALNAIVNPLPVKPFVGNDTAICSTDKLVLDPGLYNNYLWQDGSSQRSFTVNTAGSYKVVISTGAGCADSTSINIAILDNCDDVYFPSAFSPDNNGRNDKFGPLGNLFILSNYSLRIFNRFGETVFSTRDPYQKWDGTLKGKSPGNSSFVYVATYTYKNRITKTRKGTITIVR